jgi:hypothetical protein
MILRLFEYYNLKFVGMIIDGYQTGCRLVNRRSQRFEMKVWLHGGYDHLSVQLKRGIINYLYTFYVEFDLDWVEMAA